MNVPGGNVERLFQLQSSHSYHVLVQQQAKLHMICKNFQDLQDFQDLKFSHLFSLLSRFTFHGLIISFLLFVYLILVFSSATWFSEPTSMAKQQGFLVAIDTTQHNERCESTSHNERCKSSQQQRFRWHSSM